MLLATGGPIPIPPFRKFDPREIDFEKTEEGAVILEGRVGFSLSGVFGRFDTEYLVTPEGVTYYNEFLLRGIGVGVLIQLVKEGDGIVIKYPKEEER